MKIVMLGTPGAGKGTQAKMIAAKYGIPHVSTGDIFRANIKNGTELGKEAKSYMDKGALVPDELTVRILLDRVAQDDCAKGYVLDGFPRTLAQAEALDKILAARGEKVNGVISIMIPDSLVFERIAGRAKIEGRADDASPEVIAHRIQTYHSQTEPLKEYYRAAGNYYEVDGYPGTIEENRNRVLAMVETIC